MQIEILQKTEGIWTIYNMDNPKQKIEVKER